MSWNKVKKIFIFCLLVFFPTAAGAEPLAARLAGKILLQVESRGEAWYVNPDDKKRYYLGRPADAFELMKDFGLGVSNKDLEKIPVGLAVLSDADSDGDGLSDGLETALGTDPKKTDTDGDGFDDKTEITGGYNPSGAGKISFDHLLAARLAGKILLQVESRGEAWYVNPDDKKRYYLGRPADAFELMKNFGLGISNENLEKINKEQTKREESLPDNLSGLPEAPESGSPMTVLDDARKIFETAAGVIKQGNAAEAAAYFSAEAGGGVEYTVSNLNAESRGILASIMLGSSVENSGADEKIYSTYVYFNGEKIKLVFRLKKQNGHWVLLNL